MSVSTFYSKKAAAINTHYGGGGGKENMHHKDKINELNLKGCILNKTTVNTCPGESVLSLYKGGRIIQISKQYAVLSCIYNCT